MFDKFHLCDNAQIVTDSIPGEGSVRLLQEQEKYESNNRSYPRSIPIAFDTAKGSTPSWENRHICLRITHLY